MITEKNLERVRIASLCILMLLYLLDFNTTLFATQLGATENNPILNPMIMDDNYFTVACFFIFMVVTFMLFAEGVGWAYYKLTKDNNVYVIAYVSTISLMGIIILSAVINNIYTISQLI